jgi:hypothetical protein
LIHEGSLAFAQRISQDNLQRAPEAVEVCCVLWFVLGAQLWREVFVGCSIKSADTRIKEDHSLIE